MPLDPVLHVAGFIVFRTEFAPAQTARMRIAASAVMAATDTTPVTARIAQSRRNAQAGFPGPAGDKGIRAWAGVRPAMPTGLPDLGRGSLGFTLAADSADRLAALACNETSPILLDGPELRDAT